MPCSAQRKGVIYIDGNAYIILQLVLNFVWAISQIYGGI